MTVEQTPLTPTHHAVLRRFGASPVRCLGGRANEHWLVERGAAHFVLRGYAAEQLGDIAYELAVLRRLHAMGWPVPELVDDPLQCGGRKWCLFTLLPGTPRVRSPEEGRARGRILAELHASTVHLVDMGQRDGYSMSDALICGPELLDAVRAYEAIRPAEGHLLRWHLDRAREAIAGAETDTANLLVVHGDFAPWNLLFDGDKLTGVLDFEFTHLNYPVADFALSWRGTYDEVIDGYQEARPLSDREIEMVVPVFWAWLFIGVRDEIAAMLDGRTPVHGFEWQSKQLMRRSALLGERTPWYQG